MNPHAPHSLLAPIHRLLTDERRRQAADGDLLRSFMQQGEQAAFAELLRRHGPMVLRLAQHLLHHRQDAEDVFQATFLTLARKARSLRNESCVAAWLHRVAWRLCLRSRAAQRRTAGVRQLVATQQPVGAGRALPDPAEEISLREAQALLHQELAALPERLRQPLVLCYLQGRTRDEAARRLGWSLGTLKRRLEQGRKLLHARLSRRGVALSAVFSASLLASAELSASLAQGTLGLAVSCAAGSMPILSASVAALLKASSSVKVKALWGLVLMLSACAGTGAWVFQGRAENPFTPTEQSSPNPPSVAGKREKTAEPRRDLFGDPLPAGAVARLGTVRFRHADYLLAIGGAPDGKAIGYAPHGKTIISTGTDGVRVWEAATGRPVRHFGAGKWPRNVSLSADGRLIALSRYHSGSGGPIDIWDVGTGKLLQKLGDQHYSTVRFSPDGKRIAALDGVHNPIGVGIKNTPTQVEIWDTATGKRLGVWNGPTHYIADMQFSPDGKTLLLGGMNRTISIHDVVSGKEIRRLRDLPGDVQQLILSPSGAQIAVIELRVAKSGPDSGSYGAGNRVFLLDSRTGAELRRWTVKPVLDSMGMPQNGWWSLAFSPDGRRLAACQQDGPVRIWDVSSGKESQLAPEGHQHSGGLCFAPDGRTMAVGNGGRTIRVLDAETGADCVTTTGHQGGVSALTVTGDGRTVFTAVDNGTIHRWDARTGRELGRLTGHKGDVSGLTLSADERTLFSVGFDRTLRLWDLSTGKDRRLLNDTPLYGEHLTRSPDCKTLAVPIDSRELQLFRTATGERLHRLATRTRIVDVAFTADAESVLALTGDRTIWRWQLPMGRLLPSESLPLDIDEPPITNPDSASNGEKIVLSPDGRLAAHGAEDRFLRLLDLSTQRQVRRSAKLPGRISTIAFAPDGHSLAWAEQSGVIHWLELATWSERRTLSGHIGPVKQIVFSADGKWLHSASDDATALVWDLLPSHPTVLSVEQCDVCWADLADTNAAKAYRALCRFVAAPADTLAFLRPRLKSVKLVDEKQIERQIAALDADAFAVREKATEELRKLGELAEPAMRKALASRPTLEMRRRLQGLRDEIHEQQWQPAPEILRQLRALEVLERTGTPEAQALLESLAGGAAGARLTQESKFALKRLKAHPGDKP